MPAAFLCETPLPCTGNVSKAVNKYRPLKRQPGSSVWTLDVTQCGNASSKARVSDSILLKTKTQFLPNKHFKSLILLPFAFVFNCTRNELFLGYYFKSLGLGEVLPSPSKTQCNFKIAVWNCCCSERTIISEMTGQAVSNGCFTRAREGAARTWSSHCSNSMQAPDFKDLWTSPYR